MSDQERELTTGEDAQARAEELRRAEEERAKKSRKRKALIAGGAFLAASVIGTETFFGQFFKRRDIDTTVNLRYEDIDTARYRRQVVNFESGGNTLTGYFYPCDGAKATILVVHGFKSSADAFLPHIMWFVDRGYQVFAFDGTASGESEGDSQMGLQQMRFDTESAIDFLQSQGVLAHSRLLLFGHSMGGYGVAAALTRRAHLVTAVCTVSALDRPMETMTLWAKKYVGDLATIETPFLQLHDAAFSRGSGNVSASEVLYKACVPTFVIYASNDTIIPMDASVYKKVTERPAPFIRTLLVDKAEANGHTDLFFTDEAALLQKTWSGIKDAEPTRADRLKMNVLDGDLMDRIDRFYTENLE